MKATTKVVIVLCVWSLAVVSSASAGQVQTPIASDSFRFEDRGLPVFGIYDCRYGTIVSGINPRLAIAVWSDGSVIFSEALLKGEPYYHPAPLRKGKCDPTQIEACFEALEKCRFFEIERTSCYGPDSSFVEIHAVSAHRFRRLSSWHDFGPTFGQPDEDFKQVWECAKEAILQLVPKESEPLDNTPWEVLHAWKPMFGEMAGPMGSGRKMARALKTFIEKNGAPPKSLRDVMPDYVDEQPGHRSGITREYIPEVEGADGSTKECQVQIHYPPRKAGGFRRKVEWAIYRPSEEYPAQFQGHKTHLYGGWAFSLYEQQAE